MDETQESDEIAPTESWREQVERRLIVMGVAVAGATLIVVAVQVLRLAL
jgi:hypothetical protein